MASQLGSELAKLGHKVHFISYDPPFRLDLRQPNITFHPVKINEYQLVQISRLHLAAGGEDGGRGA